MIKASDVGDHILYSHDLNEWFSSITVRRNYMLITLRVLRVYVFISDENKNGKYRLNIPGSMFETNSLVNFFLAWLIEKRATRG